MRNWKKTALLVVLALLVIAQFIPINRDVPQTAADQDFLQAVGAPEPMVSLIKNACYDCHSNNTTYPWYANVAPVSFWIQHHINEGREHLNFSTWTAYPKDKALHKLEECFEETEEGHMPLPSYGWMHPEARLTEQQRSALVQWFQQLYRAES